jgi:hypothetical protein
LECLLEKLEKEHVGKPAQKGGAKNVRDTYLKDSVTGSYTKEDAEKWIAEYKKETSLLKSTKPNKDNQKLNK